ncbi:ankyrin domain-containing protein [Thecamonas trahens ATCC 50062]|uniref:Ankyrin domain-containing protein n=1 Tax=Thecamonas trahens ATCC 50062 TaxID=461836 RepID=A0A0L0D8T6_THETB|nr:ankyrin domain-containing protein [Thecamonas trahens ATCC 50062]KNC47703.1 ankyrin domain-containing protein [Thecamonas trahens ATCC 50062]|eukprot:XP_013759185.1 ankyrin domain-containing protein [Thecamonas trahens ATCC 50062]
MVLSPDEVFALACSCKRLYAALLGSRYGRCLAEATLGFHEAMARRAWGGARVALGRMETNEARHALAGLAIMPLIASGDSDDDGWRAIVEAVARAGIKTAVLENDELGIRAGRSVYWEIKDATVGAAAMTAAFEMEDVAITLIPVVDDDERVVMLDLAADRGLLRLLHTLLLQEPPIDVCASDSSALVLAATRGNVRAVKLLMDDGRVDPGADDSAALRWSASLGHFDVVRLLIADRRTDLAVDDNLVVTAAATAGRADIVAVVLASDSPRVDPAANENAALCYACGKGHAQVVAFLLADERVDAAARNQSPICWAAQHGHAEVVVLLLSDSRVDPAAREGMPLRKATERGHKEVVALLCSC